MQVSGRRTLIAALMDPYFDHFLWVVAVRWPLSYVGTIARTIYGSLLSRVGMAAVDIVRVEEKSSAVVKHSVKILDWEIESRTRMPESEDLENQTTDVFGPGKSVDYTVAEKAVANSCMAGHWQRQGWAGHTDQVAGKDSDVQRVDE